MSPLQSVLLDAAGGPPASPHGLPGCTPQAWQAPVGAGQGWQGGAGRVQNHSSHHAVSTAGTGRGQWVGTVPAWPGCEEGMASTSDGELSNCNSRNGVGRRHCGNW